MPSTHKFGAHRSRRRPKKQKCSECLELKDVENLNANNYRYICDECLEEVDDGPED